MEDPFPWRELAILSGVLLLLGLGWWWYRRSQTSTVKVPPTPHEVAYAELHHIRKLPLGTPEERKAFCFAISETLRRYLEGRFEVGATDMTSQEILDATHPILALTEYRQDLTSFFDRSDGVKFASLPCQDSDIEFLYETALTVVESTTKPPEEAAEV